MVKRRSTFRTRLIGRRNEFHIINRLKILTPVIVVICFLMFLAGCHTHGYRRDDPTVALVRLLVNPEKFNGKFVYTSGYYHHEFESSAIYLSRDDARHWVAENRIWIGDSANQKTATTLGSFNNCFISVRGRVNYEADGVGHLGAFPVGSEEIDRIMILHEDSSESQEKVSP